MILKPGVVISDRYEIIEVIGQGGMAIVYKAIDKKLDRYVTIKVLREEFLNDEEFIKRFDIEARSAGSLSHQNIVSVYDVGNWENINYIVMEFIEGITLKELIEKKAPFENNEIIGVSIQIAKALKNAHLKKIVHRDIKPENILVNTNGIVKVTDFGIARAVSSVTVAVDSTIGSVYYLSPEQARGGFIDQKSDIYSLGVVMFEMATNSLPYEGETSVSIALKHINDSFPDVFNLNPNISKSIAKIIEKATQKISNNRYKDMDEMLKDLKEAQTNDTGDFIKINEFDEQKTRQLSSSEMQEIKENLKEDKIEIKTNKDSKKNINNKKNNDKKVLFSAIITSLFIVIIMTFFYGKSIDKIQKEKAPITPPNLAGKTYQEAENKLNSLDIKVSDKPIFKFSNEIPKDCVISYDMGNRDEFLYKGDSVILVISKGEEMVNIPVLTGITIEEATEMVNNNNFIINKVYWENSTDTPTNTVYKQDPDAGKQVSKKNDILIDLYVSAGPLINKFLVDDYRGRTQAQSEQDAKDVGLIVANSIKVFSDKVEKGNVVTQKPLPGSEATQGSTQITFYISKGPEEIQEVDTGKSHTFNFDIEIPEDVENIKIIINRTKDGRMTLYKSIDNVKSTNFPYKYTVKDEGVVNYFIEFWSGDKRINFVEEEVDFDKE